MYGNLFDDFDYDSGQLDGYGYTQSPVVTAMTASYVLTPAIWRKPRWSIGTHIDMFGGGGGEGLAAVGGHQCGAKGAAVEMPAFSRNNRMR